MSVDNVNANKCLCVEIKMDCAEEFPLSHTHKHNVILGVKQTLPFFGG